MEQATRQWARASMECQKEDTRLKAALLSNQDDLQASHAKPLYRGSHLFTDQSGHP